MWHDAAVKFGYSMRCWVWMLGLWLVGSGCMAQTASAPADFEWRPLLGGGDDLSGWRVVSFGGEGPVRMEEGVLTLGMGEPMTAVVYTNPVPRTHYEIELETRRVLGNDFPCGLTFPVGDDHMTFVFGGWGGGVIGLSSIGGLDASENETGQYRRLEQNRWYSVRLSVTPEHIRVYLDGDRIINFDLRDREVGLRSGSIQLCVPLGIASYTTEGQVRNVRLRQPVGDPPPATAGP